MSQRLKNAIGKLYAQLLVLDEWPGDDDALRLAASAALEVYTAATEERVYLLRTRLPEEGE